MQNISDIKRFQFKDTSFASLMNKRIYNILLIATKYDIFILEEDGRVDEQIFDEYTSLNLRYPPRFTQVSTAEDAFNHLRDNHYELVIYMPNMDDSDMFATAREIKRLYSEIPLVVMTAFSKEVSKRFSTEDLTFADYVFSWLGNSNLLLAIIKLIEDSMNVEHDTQMVGVQIILLVEDSIRFYSSALSALFKIVLKESREFSKEALNEHQKMLRMRGRPKILLARSYEEAAVIYTQYKDNILGIVTDMSYMHGGFKEKLAGYNLAKWIKTQDRFLPIIFNSSEVSNKVYADELSCSFIDKNSKSYPLDLRTQIIEQFGFGDFIIIDPDTKEEIVRIKNLKDLQKSILTIPDKSLIYHMSHNHFSRFLYSRAMFPIAETLKKIDFNDLTNIEEARKIIYDTIVEYRRMKNSGVIAVFEKDRFDEFSNFARIGNGSLGGKGRGLAFLGNIVKTNFELNENPNFPVLLPKTVVLCTDIFDDFMESNNLYTIALSDKSDEEILQHFLEADLPESLDDDFLTFFEAVKSPLAIRSSSLLEDSYYQPFAGIYSTYMVPALEDKQKMVQLVKAAVKSVYASVFYADSKAYMTATQNVIDQEKMGIVLQEVVGSRYGNRFYPTMSGVTRSLNFYPIGHEKAEEGIANIALGLGKYIVDGGTTLRFSPYHPHNILQLSSVDFALRETQRQFYALDMEDITQEFSINDGFNLLKLNVNDAVTDDSLRFIVSTFDPIDQTIYEGFYEGGRKIISFANILQHELFPLASVLQKVLAITQFEMGRAVEIEFAVNLKNKDEATFYLLQIRPIVQNKEALNEDLTKIAVEDTILTSNNALGNGITDDVYDIIYVKTENFNASNNQLLAYEIEKLNKQFTEEDRGYILVGPGRWGSSDSWLGIPVKWPHISNARLLVESGLENYRIEPSQGTHFFQNLTSFGVGYFTINSYLENEGTFDEPYLNSLPALYESDAIRHVRFSNPLVIKINGKKKYGVVLK
ncbi:pyruvate phosphate dikinase-like enzyme [Dysgonomonas alginatilytica]|uniref:Pyruvate phosphate dikinase-like enzyme n=1 Tax=Dysgonomonas alginatilytica TaxID=1605892 RepID=A0A2V3PPS2_9BACT|nr:PEP/pyruvate-binding domain-containing protein [Dysgonomonas alginatilytica]PXV63377.1 pyruvate phosphate dikinase-like enzyme [Dysgonomonas alginatilytica]